MSPLPLLGSLLYPSIAAFMIAGLAGAQADQDQKAPDSPYTRRLEIHGIPILGTENVADEDLYVVARIYDHMTSRHEPYDLRALHLESGFRILLIDPAERFQDLPEFPDDDEELERADGLGGSIGEFFIALRVGSPHTLIHELGHGIYHSAIQFQETGGATDEGEWYTARTQALFGMDVEEAMEAHGEEKVHEVLIAESHEFTGRLAAAWRNASEKKIWSDEYAGTEPNEYWAEGVAFWFGSGEDAGADPRAHLEERDPMLFELCKSVLPTQPWSPSSVLVASSGMGRWNDEHRDSRFGRDALDPGAQLLKFLDRNRDGEVETYEGAEAFMHLSTKADKNDNGSLSESEVNLYFRSARTEEMDERRGFFSELDADEDGVLADDELPEDLAAMLLVADSDGDGAVSLDEVLNAEDIGDPMIMFEQELLDFMSDVDHDGDGAFALEDMEEDSRVEFADRFEALDVNEDDSVTEEELMALLEDELSGAEFEVRGDIAVMTGVIGPTTPGRVLQLILGSPEVQTIVMQDVPGSMDDHSNLRAAKLVRRMGLATHIPADGEVASGGTDFFLAGVRRSWEKGALFGVHSWGGFGEEGGDVPEDDPEHDKYLVYYEEMGIPTEFYWYTLEAAPASDIHWMTDDELDGYEFWAGEADEREEANDRESGDRDMKTTHLGGAILREPLSEAPALLRQVSAIERTSRFSPLAKHLNACGISLAAQEEVPDEFLTNVGAVTMEMFRTVEATDPKLQSAVLSKLYRFRAFLPVPLTEESLEGLLGAAPEEFERVESENSLCDIIMARVPEGQVMEVVEHLLHAITDVGLHHQFPNEWGISRESALWRAMQKAIEEGHYVIDQYEDIERAGQEIYDRVLLQEFAYWFISTAWNLQGPYGPTEEEWQVKDRAHLARLFPEFFGIYEQTAMKVMSAPSLETLAKIGPTRAEERGR